MGWETVDLVGSDHAGAAGAPRRDASASGLVPDGFDDAVEIGRGGCSVVFRARQRTLQRDVAVKVLDLALDDAAIALFRREAAAAGLLTGHPHIVTVFAAELERRPAYLILEYCDAGSLADRLRRSGPLPPSEVVQIGITLAEALSHVHAAGVLHRDLKPANVLVNRFGDVKLADFGIAGLTAGTDTTILRSAMTPHHAPPEFFGPNETVGPTADVYGLASTLWELLCGRPAYRPHRGVSEAQVVAAVLAGELPPLACPDAPDGLADVLARAMAIDPQERYASAADFAAALAALGACADTAVHDDGLARTHSTPPVGAVAAVPGRAVPGRAVAGVAPAVPARAAGVAAAAPDASVAPVATVPLALVADAADDDATVIGRRGGVADLAAAGGAAPPAAGLGLDLAAVLGDDADATRRRRRRRRVLLGAAGAVVVLAAVAIVAVLAWPRSPHGATAEDVEALAPTISGIERLGDGAVRIRFQPAAGTESDDFYVAQIDDNDVMADDWVRVRRGADHVEIAGAPKSRACYAVFPMLNRPEVNQPFSRACTDAAG